MSIWRTKFHTLDDITNWLESSPSEVMQILYENCEEQGECYVWTGPQASRGYGQYRKPNCRKKTRCTAHRLSFIAHHGSIPEGLLVMHLCDNPGCINPAHLVVGSHDANMVDMKLKGRAPHGSKHPRAKLTTEQAQEIRVLAKYGYAHEDLAVMFQVSRPTITKVANGTSYGRE